MGVQVKIQTGLSVSKSLPKMKMQILSEKQGWFFVGGIVGFMVVAGICFILLTLNRMAGNDKLIQAQVRYQDAMAKQVGQPTTIRQELIR